MRNFTFSGSGVRAPAGRSKGLRRVPFSGERSSDEPPRYKIVRLKLLPTSITKAEGGSAELPAVMPMIRPQASVLLPEPVEPIRMALALGDFSNSENPSELANGLSNSTSACSCPAGIPNSGRKSLKVLVSIRFGRGIKAVQTGAFRRRPETRRPFFEPLAAGAETLCSARGVKQTSRLRFFVAPSDEMKGTRDELFPGGDHRRECFFDLLELGFGD